MSQIDGGTARLFATQITGSLTNPPVVTTCATTSSSSTTLVLASTRGIFAGYPITGTGITGGTTVASVTNATTVVLSAPATVTSGATITATPTAATVTGRIISDSLTKSFGLELEEQNMAGVIETTREDDRTVTGNVTIRLNASSYVFPQEGGTLAITGHPDGALNVTYRVKTVVSNNARGAFVDTVVSLKWSEGIAL